MRAKALILLTVFLLNTLAGFSCALHMSHRQHTETAAHSEHHEHFSMVVHEKNTSDPVFLAKDFCCQGAVNNFISQAKQVPATNLLLVLAPFIYISKPIDVFLIPVTDLGLSKLTIKTGRRWPPPRDIRTAIQSFLI